MPWLVAGLLVLWLALAAGRLVVLRRRVSVEAERLRAAADEGERAIAAQRHDDRAFAFNRARGRWWARVAVPLAARSEAPYAVIQSWAFGTETASQLKRSME